MENIKLCLASFMYIEKTDLEIMKNKVSERIEDASFKKSATKNSNAKEYKLELEKEPVSVVEPFSSSNESNLLHV